MVYSILNCKLKSRLPDICHSQSTRFAIRKQVTVPFSVPHFRICLPRTLSMIKLDLSVFPGPPTFLDAAASGVLFSFISSNAFAVLCDFHCPRLPSSSVHTKKTKCRIINSEPKEKISERTRHAGISMTSPRDIRLQTEDIICHNWSLCRYKLHGYSIEGVNCSSYNYKSTKNHVPLVQL